MNVEMTKVEFDVVMATDLRFPGGTTASVAEEIEAQYRAGYRTGLLHMPSPIQRSRRPFANRIRRLLEDNKAELIAGPYPVRTPLLLIRHPSVLSEPTIQLPPIEAGHVMMVANQVPRDERGAADYFDPAEVHRNLRAVFGQEALWAPIGPGVRAALAPSGVPMREGDWENVIDLDAWYTGRRTGFVSDRPVIGRHSRGHWSKWPATRRDLLAAYPDDPNYHVRVMGGAEAPLGLLGELPPNWTTLPFDAMPVPQFLAEIDFFVYFHHPGLVEAFGRVVLEALAAGAVCIVPRELEPIFGDACQYGDPREVRGFVDSIYADPGEFLRRSRHGQDVVQARFSYQAHLDRLAPMVGEPAGGPIVRAASRTVERTNLLLYTDAAAAIDTESQRAISETFAPLVVLTHQDRTHWSGNALIETVPAVIASESLTHRDADLRRRLRHLVRAHEAGRVLLLDHRWAHPAADLGVEVELLRQVQGGDRWSSGPVPGLSGGRGSLPSLVRRVSRQGISLARRRAPRVVRRAGRRLVDAGTRVQRGVAGYTSVQNPTAIPVPRIYRHLDPKLPVVLIVVGSAAIDPEQSLDAALARAQESSAFRMVFLAPTTWSAAAAARGVALETWITDAEWLATYTARWSEYARDRLTNVARLVRPAAVVNVDQTIDPAGDPVSARVLDTIESAANARGDGQRYM